MQVAAFLGCLDYEAAQRHGLLDLVGKCFAAVGADVAVGVVLGRQEQEFDVAGVRGIRQGSFQGLACGAAAGGIAIEAEHHLVGEPEQLVHMLGGAGRAQRGHGIGKTELGQRHHIHIAFGDQRVTVLAQRGARLEQSVEFVALAENGCFGRVEVFGLFVAQHAPAKTDALPLDVADGEYDAVAEAVVAAFFRFAVCRARGRVGVMQAVWFGVVDDQAAFFEQGVCIVSKYGTQVPPAGRGVAQTEAGGDFPAQAALLEVFDGARAGFELFLVAAGGFLQHIGQRGLLPAPGFGADAVLRTGVVIWNLHAVLLRQFLHGIDKAHAVVFHQEIDGVPILAAAKAMVELLARADGERRRFFAVEGTQPAVVGAGFLQLHVAAHHVDHIDAREQFLNEAVRDGHADNCSWRGC